MLVDERAGFVGQYSGWGTLGSLHLSPERIEVQDHQAKFDKS